MTDPFLITGGIHNDERGEITFVNDFSFQNIERFYIIENTETKPLRAWQGHKLDEKNFYCIIGEFKIGLIKIDDWVNPSKDLKIEWHNLKATNPQILKIPPGYANAVWSLTKGAKLISFSTLPLNRLKDDDVRFPIDYWNLNE